PTLIVWYDRYTNPNHPSTLLAAHGRWRGRSASQTSGESRAYPGGQSRGTARGLLSLRLRDRWLAGRPAARRPAVQRGAARRTRIRVPARDRSPRSAAEGRTRGLLAGVKASSRSGRAPRSDRARSRTAGT